MLYRPSGALPPVRQALREARLAWGLSVEDIAIRMGTGIRTVYSYENGNGNPSLDSLTNWAHVLGYDVEIKLVPKR